MAGRAIRCGRNRIVTNTRLAHPVGVFDDPPGPP